jgi:hypothetical protein
VEIDWHLPPAVGDVLEQHKTKLATVDHALRADDLTTASEKLTAAIRSLKTDLDDAFRRWREVVLRELASFPRIANLPQGVSNQASELFDQVHTLLMNAGKTQQATNLEHVKAAAKAVAEARQVAGDMIGIILRGVSTCATSVLDLLDHSHLNLPDPEAVRELARAVGELDDLNAWDELDKLTPPYSGATSLDAVRALAGEVLNKTRDAIMNQATTPQEKALLEPDLGEKKYQEAAKNVVKWRLRKLEAERGADVLLGDSDLLAAQNAVANPTPPVQLAGLSPVQSSPIMGSFPLFRLFQSAEPIEPTVARTLGQIFVAELFQFAFVALGLSLIAVSIFKGTFVGTWENCMAVVFWAFTLDIGVNTLLDKAKTLKQGWDARAVSARKPFVQHLGDTGREI